MVGIIAGGLVGQHGILGPTNHAGRIEHSSASVAVAVGSGTPTNVNGSCTGNCMFNAAGGLVGANVAALVDHVFECAGERHRWRHVLRRRAGRPEWFHRALGSHGIIENSFATGNVTVTGSQLLRRRSCRLECIWLGRHQFAGVRNSYRQPERHDPITFAKAGGLVGQNDSLIDSTTMPRRPSDNATPQSACLQGASYSCATGGVSVGARAWGAGWPGATPGSF